MEEDHDHDHDVGEIFETSSQQSNGSTSDANRHAAFGIGEELIKDDNPNDQDQTLTSRSVQRHEQHRRLGKTVPGQHAIRINESTSDIVHQTSFGNIGHEETAASLGIGHEEVAANFGIGHEEAATFGIGEEFEDDNPNEEKRPRVSTREQRRRLGKTVPGQHAIRINESTSDAVRQTTFGNIGHEEVAASFGIGHEEAVAFGIGEEFEDDNPNEERRPRVPTHEQHRRLGKIVPGQHAIRINESTSDAVRQATFGNIGREETSASLGIGHKEVAANFGIGHEEAATFGIGEEFEDDNPNEERRPRVSTREQRRRLGKTIPGQHAIRINESTSDAVRQAAFGNIVHEEATANFGIGHEEAAANFGIGHEEAAAFGIGEEFEDDNPNEERRPTVPTHEQHKRLGKTVPGQHAIRINESTSDAVRQATFGNISYEEAAANFGVGHAEAIAFGIVHEEAAAFAIGGEEDDNPNEERRPRVQTRHQGKKSRTVVPECAIRINDNERQKPVIISGSGWSTLKVPAPMFKVDKGAYIPKIVSIDPFHYNEPSLRAMQTQKRRFLNRLIRNRTGEPILEESLKNAMRELEEKTRDFYAEDFQAIKRDDFVQMMLLDGCFIVELLRLYEKKYEGEPIFETRWTLPNISRDFLLLENQLPLFVLQKIFELTTLKGEASSDLNMLALRYFEPLKPGKDEFETFTLQKNVDGDYIHLLALFHSTLTSENNIYMQQPKKSEKKKTHLMLRGKGWVHNAKTLHYAGIQFKNNSGSILDIKLKGKTLKIPTMIIDDSTGPLLRNLIAYEQNNRSAAPYVCCLAVFLDSIMDTVEDARIFRDAGIIKQAKGGDEEVANLFNSLTKELVLDIDKDYCYMTEQIEDINRLCRAHDTRVRICQLLATLNYKGLLTTYASILVTIIFSLFAANFASYRTPVNQYYSPPPPPPP